MIIIDGSMGEGGGQILRSSLALSLVTGKPFKIENIRSGRKKPGLLRQHLTAVKAAVEIGQAQVEGANIGSQELTFVPGQVRCGAYEFAVGTAGSATLVFQTVLPCLLTGKGKTSLVLEGGTHNPMAPPYDFLEKVFVPIVNRMGPKIRTGLESYGFYPAGGGKFTVEIDPVESLSRVDFLERGEVLFTKGRAIVANLPPSIGSRETKIIGNKLSLESSSLEAVEVKNSPGPGNMVSIEIVSENIAEVITGFGIKGVSAEKIAEKASKEALEYLASGAPVGRHLADQLLIPMALAGGGKFRTLSPSRHTLTNIEVLKRFIDVEISVERIEDKVWEIGVEK